MSRLCRRRELLLRSGENAAGAGDGVQPVRPRRAATTCANRDAARGLCRRVDYSCAPTPFLTLLSSLSLAVVSCYRPPKSAPALILQTAPRSTGILPVQSTPRSTGVSPVQNTPCSTGVSPVSRQALSCAWARSPSHKSAWAGSPSHSSLKEANDETTRFYTD